MASGILIKLPFFSPGINGLDRANKNELKYRFFSVKSFNSVKFNGNFPKSVVDKPLSAVASAFSRYREAVGLQVEAFWTRNYLALVGAGAAVVCIALWRIMFGVASTFVELSEAIPKYGFLAFEASVVAFAYDMRLLAVDIPMTSGPDQQLFLIGDVQEYQVGGGLISELRDPTVKAMAAEKEFEDLDQKEEEDTIREHEEVERRQHEEKERAFEEEETKRMRLRC